MLIFGVGLYFKSRKVRSWGYCELCQAFKRQLSYQATSFGHLYFIPLAPLSGRIQVMRECNHCGAGSRIPKKQLTQFVEMRREQLTSSLSQIRAGQRELQLDGVEEPVDLVSTMSAVVSDLHCVKEIENIESISQAALQQGMRFENEMIRGRWFEMTGDDQQAITCYGAAHRERPDDPLPIYEIGTAQIRRGNAAEAEVAFAKYLQLNPGDSSVFFDLATLFEKQKNWNKVVEYYDKIYSMSPELVSNQQMMMAYKRACKKCGLQGRYLN